LDCHASDISEGMKLAAAAAIAAVAEQDGLREDYILPDAFDKRVTINVAAAVAQAAAEEGIARRPMTFEEEVEQAKAFVN
jgi:malate dehydrogenase (oxaloacetate-decarboxylating)